jgi:aldose 1-epimerase
MAVRIGQFGDDDVYEVTLTSAAGAQAHIMTWGAVVRDLIVPVANGGQQRVVLGFDTFDPYPAHSPHFGAIAGRFANRINEGQFVLDGVAHQVTRNQNDPPSPDGTPRHHLHGGRAGFGKRNWRLIDHGKSFVTLALVSHDGDEGYPGKLITTCTYTLAEPATLRVELTAATDAPTIVNLAHHSYFNLDGSADIGAHVLQIDGDFRTPTDASLIPTGEIVAVAGTAHDFRTAKPMACHEHGHRQKFDGNFVLRQADGFKRAARVECPSNSLSLEVWTTEPAVQFYDGAKLGPAVPGLGGVSYGPFAGFCLEPQRFPDSPNKAHFTDVTLRPGDVYAQTTEYRFA